MSVDYSRMASDYDAVRGHDRLDREFWFAGIAEVGHLQPGERVLDLGAGTGRFARIAAETAHVVAADTSWEMLSQARGKGRFPLVRADAHVLPFRADAFDLAMLVMVLHQLGDFRQALREVRRVSRRAVVATADMASRAPDILDEAFPSLARIDRARFPEIGALADALYAAGFAQVEVVHRPYRRLTSVEEQLDRVRRKYISTLDLLPPGEFERGLAYLERELPRRYGPSFETSRTFTFLGASR